MMNLAFGLLSQVSDSGPRGLFLIFAQGRTRIGCHVKFAARAQDEIYAQRCIGAVSVRVGRKILRN